MKFGVYASNFVMRNPMLLLGQCHCGNVEVAFETSAAVDELSLRICSCSFCSKQGARYASDPHGEVRIIVHDETDLIRYRFGLATADFLICKRCGIYVGATFSGEGATYAVLNVNALGRADELTRLPIRFDYHNETIEERTARRTATWTPVKQG